MNVYLIGPRACGKTTLGKDLAEKLNRPFADTDDMIVEKIGMSIADFVEANDWDAFRDVESSVMAEVDETDGMVVACGGGMVLRKENRALLQRGAVLYIQIDPEELTRRLSSDPRAAQRPALTDKGLLAEIREVVEERAPLYEECADRTLLLDGYEMMLDRAFKDASELLVKG